MSDSREKAQDLWEWGKFLTEHPPQHGSPVKIAHGYRVENGGYKPDTYHLLEPDIELFCEFETCDGNRLFEEETNGSHTIYPNRPDYFFLFYRCKNCEMSKKVFSLGAYLQKEQDEISLLAVKLGEDPVFHPSIPRRVINWFDKKHIEMLKKALRAEKQGMGLGSYSYYRRIVEDQKVKLFEKMIKISQYENSPAELIQQLQAAKDNWQFSDSVSTIKKAIPESLKIKGHNPLLLLHNALSDGIHNLSDEECLERAQSIREILVLLGERMAQVEDEDDKISSALETLMLSSSKKKQAGLNAGQAEQVNQNSPHSDHRSA